MTKRGALLLVFNCIFFPLLLVIMGYQYLQVEKVQNLETEQLLKKISYGVNRENIENVMTGQPKDRLYAIWYETAKDSWFPIVKGEGFDGAQYKSPFTHPLPRQLRRFEPEDSSALNNKRFIVWVNRYDSSLYIKTLAPVLLYMLIIYFIVFILIFFLFQERGDEVPVEAHYYRESEETATLRGGDYDDEEDREDVELFHMQEGAGEKLSEEDEPTEELHKDELKVIFDEPINDANNAGSASGESDFNESIPELNESASLHLDESKGLHLDESKMLHLDEFKELWRKDFKISDNFKENFPFDDIDRLIRFGLSPEEYISRGLEIAGRFFGWEEPALYIYQKGSFVENSTKRVLDESRISVPENGTAKGESFIPLYPYNKERIFGYFKFLWNSREVFYIADMIFFLKYLFSEEAKYIFANSKENREVKNRLEERLEQSDELNFGVIRVDDMERLLVDYSPAAIETLDMAVNENVRELLKDYTVHSPFPLYYIFYGNIHRVSELVGMIELWLFDNELHNYFISSKEGNIAITLSAGLSEKRGRDIDGATLINEAESYLQEASEGGGSQLVTG